ncbi:hypothetical protein EIN_130200 [Entamoeba invadens IP1]|uniref:Uncharacterized protein n=1 Tax=Entamoeba invadens IP1 TaxID=370355 RepID=A0A0A1UCZ7_ENTIV|nr:hypothetical protein EIN_130200 [Entamoeba invadens IP1]ELP94301.1 hypothetical protein EIN_130200 [Entamoeba invadens IP1]|eukprot:XP_004261072.1 hypothetical protein EIN_130200 [Entamoeba invadens IP1]
MEADTGNTPTLIPEYTRLSTKLSKLDFQICIEPSFLNSKTLKVTYDVIHDYTKGSWIALYDEFELHNERYLKFVTLPGPDGSFYFENLVDGLYELRYFPKNDGKLKNTYAVKVKYTNAIPITFSLDKNILELQVLCPGIDDVFIKVYKKIFKKNVEDWEETTITFPMMDKTSKRIAMNIEGKFVIRSYRKSAYLYYRRGLKFSWDYISQGESAEFCINSHFN